MWMHQEPFKVEIKEGMEVPGLRATGNSGHLSWGPPAFAFPSLANAMQNNDRAVLTTIPLWYFQSKSHVFIFPGQ